MAAPAAADESDLAAEIEREISELQTQQLALLQRLQPHAPPYHPAPSLSHLDAALQFHASPASLPSSHVPPSNLPPYRNPPFFPAPSVHAPSHPQRSFPHLASPLASSGALPSPSPLDPPLRSLHHPPPLPPREGTHNSCHAPPHSEIEMAARELEASARLWSAGVEQRSREASLSAQLEARAASLEARASFFEAEARRADREQWRQLSKKGRLTISVIRMPQVLALHAATANQIITTSPTPPSPSFPMLPGAKAAPSMPPAVETARRESDELRTTASAGSYRSLHSLSLEISREVPILKDLPQPQIIKDFIAANHPIKLASQTPAPSRPPL
ncbi:MAG: hypothetical protein SGPRY_012602, partial [Prymnesium sp.]